MGDRSTTVWIGNIPDGLTKEEIEENFKQAGTVKYCSLGKGGTGKVEYSTAAEAKRAIEMFNGTEINGSALHVDPWTGGGSGGASGRSGGESAGEDVEAFILSSGMDERAAGALREEAPAVQKRVVARGSLADARNPSAAVMCRIRDAKSGGGGNGGGNSFGGNPMMQMFQKMAGGGAGKSWGNGNGSKSWGNQDRSTTIWIGNIPEGITQEELAENFKQAGTIKKTNLTKGRTGIIEYTSADEAQKAITMFNGSEVNGSALHVDAWTKKQGGSGGSKSWGGNSWSSAQGGTKAALVDQVK